MPNWYVYILRCADDSLYTGITTSVERRLREHNDAKLGARYTRTRRPVTLAYSEMTANRSAASQREAAIKKLTRKEKLDIIQSAKHS